MQGLVLPQTFPGVHLPTSRPLQLPPGPPLHVNFKMGWETKSGGYFRITELVCDRENTLRSLMDCAHPWGTGGGLGREASPTTSTCRCLTYPEAAWRSGLGFGVRHQGTAVLASHWLAV